MNEIGWRKASRSSATNCCVEVAVAWRKSSRSSETANCVEVAEQPDVVLVRDSKCPDGPRLTFATGSWRDFVAGVRVGEFG